MTQKLSKRAEALLKRVKAGHFYKPHDLKCPKAMQDLLDAGLVSVCGRSETIVAAYVPTEDYHAEIPERHGDGPAWVQAATLRSAAEIMARHTSREIVTSALRLTADRLDPTRKENKS